MNEPVMIKESNVLKDRLYDFIERVKTKTDNINSDILYICEGGYRGWIKDSTYENCNIELYVVYKFKSIDDYRLIGNRKNYNFKSSTGGITCRMYEITELIQMLINGDIRAWEILQSKVVWVFNSEFYILKESYKSLFDGYRIMLNIQEELRKLIYNKDISVINIISRTFNIMKYYTIGYHICTYEDIFPMDINKLCKNIMCYYENNKYMTRYLENIGDPELLGQITTQIITDNVEKFSAKFYNSLDNRITNLKTKRKTDNELIEAANNIIRQL